MHLSMKVFQSLLVFSPLALVALKEALLEEIIGIKFNLLPEIIVLLMTALSLLMVWFVFKLSWYVSKWC